MGTLTFSAAVNFTLQKTSLGIAGEYHLLCFSCITRALQRCRHAGLINRTLTRSTPSF